LTKKPDKQGNSIQNMYAAGRTQASMKGYGSSTSHSYERMKNIYKLVGAT
jgi:hypothetical protein